MSLCANLMAQEDYHKHEFSLGGSAGVMSLNHKLIEGEGSSSMSGGIGFGYTYFFKKNIGITTGLDFAFYNQDLKFGELSGNQQAFDIDLQKDFEFRYSLFNYKEEQSVFYLNIPIMLNFQYAETESVAFYAAGGFKIGLPINGKYKSAGGDLKTSGYFPHNGDVIDDIPFRGFGEFPVTSHDDKIKYGMSFSLAFETGAKWELPNNMFLYTGVFVDYGLNDIKEKQTEENLLVQYNSLNPEDHIYNGILSSTYQKDGQNKSIISKINTMGYGIKVRLAFGK